MTAIVLRPWSADDLPLLRRANTPVMTSHLNGPESEDELAERHDRYLRLNESGEARMFVIDDAYHRSIGSIGYWSFYWRGEPALETGWFVLPEAQGRGVASAALALVVADARMHRGGRRFLTAFPAKENAASNGVCRRAGFELVGAITERFRDGDLSMNEWMLDLERSPTRR